MKFLISGSTGLVGSALSHRLTLDGHEVTSLVRGKRTNHNGIVWDPLTGETNLTRWENFDVVIHLAGESVAENRWNEKIKKRIAESRIIGTKNLARNLESLTYPPSLLISASAIGYYGDRSDSVLDEMCGSGRGFLAEVAEEWEDSSQVHPKSGVRIVNTRFGIILSEDGGALEKMLTPFKMGVGGRLGSGKQYMSWIGIEDVCESILHLIFKSELSGPVNIVSPNPVTNLEFTKTLGSVIKRPTIFPVPEFALKTIFGTEMSQEMFLSSMRVIPQKLIDDGFQFKHPKLKDCLNNILK